MRDVGGMRQVGIIGWRGMVGSVLLDRMRSEGDLSRYEVVYFTTSSAGAPGPDGAPLADAYDVRVLATLPVLVSCQGGDYTARVYPALRAAGWAGVWIDAASTLRMEPDVALILDPVNRDVIDEAVRRGVRTFAGPNCTVSLMMMGIAGLLRGESGRGPGEVEWVSTMTYQAASGAGAAQMRELVLQWQGLVQAAASTLADPAQSVLALEREVTAAMRSPNLPIDALGYPLAASLLPWVDKPMPGGQSKEEWKGHVEANKILGLQPEVPVDGLCVRVGSLRCHASAVTLKLRRELPLDEIEARLAASTPWTRLVPNTPEATRAALTPAAVSGTLLVPVGRVHRLRMGPDYITAFTVGDQLLWGAAEPLRRMLHILDEHGV